MVRVLLHNGEYAYYVKAKWPTKCRECGQVVQPNCHLWLDYIPLREHWGGRTHWCKVVCEACWRGPKNVWKK